MIQAGEKRRGLVVGGLVFSLVPIFYLHVVSAGLTVSTIFPTDPTGAPTTLSGYVHRYAGAVMFLALPAAGVLIARKFPALLGVAITASVSSAAFLVSHVSFAGFEARGLTERVLFASLYGLLFAIAALQVRRTS